ncbi:MAG TPA: hypothetical protein VGV09_20150 [Steroidobacteraceae bacterium]|nr:hypothetical protein [Steroidobacteraceae bacterium]
MTTVIKINPIRLDSGAMRYYLDDAAHILLREYLEWTRNGLHDDPETEPALRELEGSIGARLAVVLNGARRRITRADLQAVFAGLGSDDFLTQTHVPRDSASTGDSAEHGQRHPAVCQYGVHPAPGAPAGL